MPEHQPVATPEPPAPDRDEWFEDTEELPPRPRRRLLGGVAGNPLALALLGVLLIACGFIGGVLVEKGESSPSSAAGGSASLASRFAALRGGASSTGARSGAAGTAGGSSSSGAGFTRPTAGTVAYLDGSTLYVTNTEGNTVKVTTSAATSVNKTVKANVSGIRPGETVTVTGSSGANGAISAEAISVGSSGGGGLAALFGGGGRASSGGGSGGGAASGGKEPQLFGGGG
ncbi:MAG TPA: hypothetical protein VK765_00495 [Solirubrobacteraceae bacterium]|jgi:hypothetical protein|nr:hypothetical protein [Solirubrobacteraceae bacterium]